MNNKKEYIDLQSEENNTSKEICDNLIYKIIMVDNYLQNTSETFIKSLEQKNFHQFQKTEIEKYRHNK